MLYVSNAFSLGMLKHPYAQLDVSEVSEDYASHRLREEPWVSSIGHEATAQIITKLTGVYVPCHRQALRLDLGDEVLVFQLKLRLPEGKTLSEPELAELLSKQLYSWRLVRVSKVGGKCNGYERSDEKGEDNQR